MFLANGTLLVLSPLSGLESMQLTPYSARGLTQTYEVFNGGGSWLRRDVNGILRSIADTRFRKYKTTVSCKDGETPCLDNGWIGIICDVSCVFEFSFPVGGFPARPVVAGSERTVGNVTYYRPMLTCMVEEIRAALPEYPALYDWQIDLQEI